MEGEIVYKNITYKSFCASKIIPAEHKLSYWFRKGKYQTQKIKKTKQNKNNYDSYD